MNRFKAEAALAGNTIVWGATFVVVKSALADVSPLVFLALRFTVATGALLAVFGSGRLAEARRRGGADPKSVGAGILVGLFLFGGYLLQTLGLQYTSAPKSAFLTGLMSVMVPFVAALVYRTWPRASELLGVLTATVGLGLMTLEGSIGSINRGDVLTIGCAVAFAAHIVILGHYSEKMSFEILSVTQVATAAVAAGSTFWWAETPRLAWRPPVIYAVLVTAILATAVAFTVQAWAQRHTSSTRTALIYTLEPIFAWITSYLLVREGLSKRAAMGAALILIGVVVVEVKPLNRQLHPSKQRGSAVGEL